MSEGYIFHQYEVIVYLGISLKQVNLLWYWNNIEARDRLTVVISRKPSSVLVPSSTPDSAVTLRAVYRVEIEYDPYYPCAYIPVYPCANFKCCGPAERIFNSLSPFFHSSVRLSVLKYKATQSSWTHYHASLWKIVAPSVFFRIGQDLWPLHSYLREFLRLSLA